MKQEKKKKSEPVKDRIETMAPLNIFPIVLHFDMLCFDIVRRCIGVCFCFLFFVFVFISFLTHPFFFILFLSSTRRLPWGCSVPYRSLFSEC